MPIFDIYCEICGIKKEVICKYEDLENIKCEKCNSNFAISVSKSGFKVDGYSYANGYDSVSGDTDYSYDGSVKSWEN